MARSRPGSVPRQDDQLGTLHPNHRVVCILRHPARAGRCARFHARISLSRFSPSSPAHAAPRCAFVAIRGLLGRQRRREQARSSRPCLRGRRRTDRPRRTADGRGRWALTGWRFGSTTGGVDRHLTAQTQGCGAQIGVPAENGHGHLTDRAGLGTTPSPWSACPRQQARRAKRRRRLGESGPPSPQASVIITGRPTYGVLSGTRPRQVELPGTVKAHEAAAVSSGRHHSIPAWSACAPNPLGRHPGLPAIGLGPPIRRYAVRSPLRHRLRSRSPLPVADADPPSAAVGSAGAAGRHCVQRPG